VTTENPKQTALCKGLMQRARDRAACAPARETPPARPPFLGTRTGREGKGSVTGRDEREVTLKQGEGWAESGASSQGDAPGSLPAHPDRRLIA